MFKTMNISYASKNLTYPIDHLLEITLLNGKNSIRKFADLKLLSVIDQDNQLLFTKQTNIDSINYKVK
jgi:hypothetical protein